MKKLAHELNREFSKEEVQVTSKYMKKCSSSPNMKEIKSKQHLDFISPNLEWPYSRKVTTLNSTADVAKEEHLHTVGGDAN
jgi:hypothetical protein